MSVDHVPVPSTSSGSSIAPRTRSAGRATRTAVALGVSGLLTLSLVGCSGSKGATTPGTDQPAAAPKASTGVVSPKLTKVPDLKGSQGVVKDAKLTGCSTEPGDVEAKGTVVNSAAKARDIVIVVSWVTPTSDVVARGVTALKAVEPGQTSDWSATSKLKFNGGAQCVMTVNAGTLKT